MSSQEIGQMAHLMRRAGFSATRDELEDFVGKGYESVVEELLHPGDPQNMPDDIIRRYHTEQSELRLSDGAAAYWRGPFHFDGRNVQGPGHDHLAGQ